MSGAVLDLRSDFLTRPTAPMLRVMAEAAASPAAFGLREDPYQRRLETSAAELLGKPDALLFPTCTMANEAAIMLWARPGEALVCESGAHVAGSEAGAPAALAGVTLRGLPGEHGAPPIEAWRDAVLPPRDAQRSRAALFVLEQTHNRAAGAALPLAYMDAVAVVAREAGAKLHLDGARLFNAAIALDVEPARLARDADSVAVSLNKGLGAPQGAVLAGPREFIAEALRIRQMLGGGIRPSGMIAAAGLVALEDRAHLAEDHRRAARLAKGTRDLPGLMPLAPPCPTNIVVLRLAPALGGAVALACRLEAEGVLALPFGPDLLRLVTYREVTDADVTRALEALARAASPAPGSNGPSA
jgi:threonine aldolase